VLNIINVAVTIYLLRFEAVIARRRSRIVGTFISIRSSAAIPVTAIPITTVVSIIIAISVTFIAIIIAISILRTGDNGTYNDSTN
jgi:hypothetical protein